MYENHKTENYRRVTLTPKVEFWMSAMRRPPEEAHFWLPTAGFPELLLTRN
jgi:hypothetical protein